MTDREINRAISESLEPAESLPTIRGYWQESPLAAWVADRYHSDERWMDWSPVDWLAGENAMRLLDTMAEAAYTVNLFYGRSGWGCRVEREPMDRIPMRSERQRAVVDAYCRLKDIPL